MSPLTLDHIDTATLVVESPEFGENEMIPVKFACEGENVNPTLNIRNIPKQTQSLALIMEDPDAPHGTFDHWVVWNIPPQDTIAENTVPGTVGKNGKEENNYTGPCPPSGTHHYHFKVFALDTVLDLPDTPTGKEALEKAMEGHIIGSGVLIGLFEKIAIPPASIGQ
jgi:Raf kinase inhibitor-like YbhB/YbcL family protein